jgi:hypothetical protein
MRLAGTIGPLLTSASLTVLVNFPGVEIWILGVADVLENEGLAAVAHELPTLQT